MGMIINIDEGLKNRAEYNIFREPLNDMLKDRQEAWEKQNPIDLLFHRGTLDKFSETYTDTIGFSHAFAETGDYGVAPIFNTHEGFSQVYTSRTFQGGFVITKQLIEDQAYNKVKTTAAKFITRWHGDQVEYALKAIFAGFGKSVTFGDSTNGGESILRLYSADTTDGDTSTATKNPLFSNAHTIVKRKGMSAADITAAKQSNLFCVSDGASSPTYGIDLDGDDPGKVAKLADVINQVITIMENYKDDNNKYAGVSGAKTIVAPNDSRLKAMLESALSMDMFAGIGPNPSYKRATLQTTPYLRDLECCYDYSGAGNATTKKAVGFFIVDPAYNSENQGPEFTQRVAFTLNVNETKNPYGISYDARERFDINVCSWRGISFVYIGAGKDVSGDAYVIPRFTPNAANDWSEFTAIVPISTIVKPVSVTGTVSTKEVAAT